MISGDDLAQAIYDNLKNEDASNSSNDIAGKYERTFQKYLIDNLEATGIYTGTNPTSGATITLNVTGKVLYPSFSFLPAANGVAYHTQLAAAVMGGKVIYSSDDKILAAPPALFATGFFFNLFPATYDVEKNDALGYMKQYCNNIVSQIKSNFKVAPSGPASYNAFVGTVAFTSFK